MKAQHMRFISAPLRCIGIAVLKSRSRSRRFSVSCSPALHKGGHRSSRKWGDSKIRSQARRDNEIQLHVFWIATNDKLAKTDKKLFLRISISFTLSQPLQDEIGITERRSPTLHRRFDELELRERAMIVCDALTGMRRKRTDGTAVARPRLYWVPIQYRALQFAIALLIGVAGFLDSGQNSTVGQKDFQLHAPVRSVTSSVGQVSCLLLHSRNNSQSRALSPSR